VIIRITGRGVAALCCARVLAERGWEVRLEAAPPPRLPLLVLNGVTVALLEEIFGDGAIRRAGGHPLRARQVRWGTDTFARVEEPSLGVAGDVLVESLLAELLACHAHRVALDPSETPERGAPLGASPTFEPESGWTIAGGGGSGGGARRQCWGTRKLLAGELPLQASDDATTWMESTPRGWVFMAPRNAARAMVQAVVPAVAADPRAQLLALLGETREIRHQVGGHLDSVRIFTTAPAIAEPVCRPGWIAVGEDAVRLDPLSGEGTGYAIRTAILAASVLDAIAAGLPAAEGLAHYRARLHATFASHLRACLAFYDAAGFDATWEAERRATRAGLDHLEGALATWPGFTLGLRGFTLVPLTPTRDRWRDP
jgi:2-polyprenyl-6-methoxyphenol hydroxylase-like FAD-dependent oxidoreductase